MPRCSRRRTARTYRRQPWSTWVFTVLLALTVIVEVPEPGAAIDVLLNEIVVPLPSPDADNAIAESKLPDTAVVIFTVPDSLRVTDNEVGEAVSVNPAVTGDVTVNETVVVFVSPPPVPVTVIV